MRKTLLAVLPFVLGAVSACASAQAKGSDKPTLNVPPPPPHEIELPAQPLEPVGEVPGAPAGAETTAPRSNRPAATRPQPGEAKPESKSEAPKADTPPVTPPPEPAPNLPPPASAPLLKTPQTADTGTAAKAVRTTIDRAKNTLNGVNFGPLSSERKKAYKDAQLFLQQAEDALKEGNIVLAQAVATKAETLARELAGR